MSDIADKIYAATGLTLGAEAAAAIGRLIQVENEKLRAKQADRIAELEAALLSAKQHFVADEPLKAFVEICFALKGRKKDE